MLCGSQLEISGRIVPCGQCMPCRINKKRMWTGRILLESMHTPLESSFVTLTYDQEHVPQDGSLSYPDLQGYINRLRHRTSIGHFRYFAVGEYGDKTFRPHYHLVTFGVPPSFEEELTNAWHEKGMVHIGELNRATAGYISGYTTKKMTSPDDVRLDGKKPEFSIQSRKPPIGASGINHIETLLQTKNGAKALQKHKDIPNNYCLGGMTFPLGNYWRHNLRARFGITNPPVNSAWQLDIYEETKKYEKANKLSTKLWQRVKKESRTL